MYITLHCPGDFFKPHRIILLTFHTLSFSLLTQTRFKSSLPLLLPSNSTKPSCRHSSLPSSFLFYRHTLKHGSIISTSKLLPSNSIPSHPADILSFTTFPLSSTLTPSTCIALGTSFNPYQSHPSDILPPNTYIALDRFLQPIPGHPAHIPPF